MALRFAKLKGLRSGQGLGPRPPEIQGLCSHPISRLSEFPGTENKWYCQDEREKTTLGLKGKGRISSACSVLGRSSRHVVCGVYVGQHVSHGGSHVTHSVWCITHVMSYGACYGMHAMVCTQQFFLKESVCDTEVVYKR